MPKPEKTKAKSRTAKKPNAGIVHKFKLWQVILLVVVVAVVGLVIVRLSFASEDIDTIYAETKNEVAAANAGRGNNEGVSVPCKVNADGSRSGAATGWAYDPLNSSASTQMHLYFDAPGGPGFPVTANLPSGDVNAAFGISGAHRYSFPIPAQYYDGINHSITAYAIGSSGNTKVNWIVFNCSPKAAVAQPPSKPPTTPPTPTKPTTPTTPGTTPKTDPTKPANPVVVADVIARISSPNIQDDQKATGTNGSNSGSTNPSQLVTVDLLDTNKNLSAAELIAIDHKIDEIQSESLKTISGTVILKPNIATDKGVVMVGYYLNKRLAYYSTKAPYNFDFDTTRYRNGTYRLDVVGFDKDGNQVTRLVQKFNIENHLNLLDRLYNDITYPIYRLQNRN